ncbi:uncharacterized protein KQ657_005201 [Scheffersomyces spartinae]|uniref:Obg-like ATPase homolog n=1 Tax=Scheffersomyces spartinae TaxID=45513 RepID=A0A9P7V9Y7_9ASCO|nr:uncharacterized protein KQ657_005201 [Scheffersomyces spartinae]KAG7194002.1 hypothetical protein KQ657_005201 [Scheffersomyces spartinae]
MKQVLRCLSSGKRLLKPGGDSKQLGRFSNNLSAGVVGLANVGKSTFFQAITKSQLGNPANYPFATIEPCEALVTVPSAKLDHLARLYGSGKTVPTTLKIHDIAGLVRNASSGAGLGNKFLNDIRQVDGIFQIVRGFVDDEIVHVENNLVDPLRDLMIVGDELILKDLEFVESGLELKQKDLKRPHIDKIKLQLELDTLNKLLDTLYEGRKISSGEWDDEEIDIINSYNFLTAKPSVYLLNVSESEYVSGKNQYKEKVQLWINENCPGDQLLMFLAAFESKYNELESSPKELAEYLSGFEGQGPNTCSALPTIVESMREALNLISFYTCGPKEAHQWTTRNGWTAPKAAGVIHTDFEKSFISAQVYKYSDLQTLEPPFDEASLKSKGKQYRQGKNYIVEDGDVLLIKAVGGKAR